MGMTPKDGHENDCRMYDAYLWQAIEYRGIRFSSRRIQEASRVYPNIALTHYVDSMGNYDM